ncbi:MAG: aldolase/citrate lyase family protein [Xanthobacteraceae bacterium]
MADAPRELLHNSVKDKLARDQVVASLIVRLVRSVEIAQIAKTAGFDSFYIDMEHNSFSFDTTGQLCMAGLAAGIAPFVRVPSIAPHYISRALDGGALGIIAPHIHSARDAAEVVRAAKFGPLGDRSIAGGIPHLQVRPFSTVETVNALNAATMVVVMIETTEALAELDEIARVEGVDLLLIGTNDLCSSLGIPGQLEHGMVRDAYAKAIQTCRKHGKHLGVGGLSNYPGLTAEFVNMGARYVSTGTDLSFLLGAATAKAKQVHEFQSRLNKE